MTAAAPPAPRVAEHRIDLVREILARDVRLRYRRSVLGLLWSQLNPLAQIAIFSLIFTRVVPLHIRSYTLFVFVGVITWEWFDSGLLAATTSVVAGRDLMRQPGFPGALLPPLAIAGALVQYVLSLPVLFVVMLLSTGRIPATAIALPFVVAVQFLITVGPAYILASLHVFMRDTAQVLAITLRVMFFASPVIYDTAQLGGSRFRLLYVLNPMARLITAQRDLLLFGHLPAAGPLIVVAAIGVVLAVAGRLVFALGESRFAEEI
jgi:lipopolysaccharide transport system permease protein